MQLLQELLLKNPLQSILIYLGIGFVVWYITYSLQGYLNGASVGKGRGWVFKCFWEEMQWFLPGGLAIRTEYIRRIVASRPNSTDSVGRYSHKEIQERNLYEQVAKEALGNGFRFWGINVILMFLLWPLIFVFFSAIFALNGLRDIAAFFFPFFRN
jgi:hypothetical protein